MEWATVAAARGAPLLFRAHIVADHFGGAAAVQVGHHMSLGAGEVPRLAQISFAGS